MRTNKMINMNSGKVITTLKHNQVLVYSTNSIYANSTIPNLAEQSYIIDTFNLNRKKTISELIQSIKNFKGYTINNPEKDFLVTLIGCGIAGFSIPEIKKLFIKINWSINVFLPLEFQNIEFIKGFDKNLKCRNNTKFRIGKTFTIDNKLPLELCSSSIFHFCESLQQVHKYYNYRENNRYCIIKPIGKIISDTEKCGTKGIKIIRELPASELKKLIGLEQPNTGLFNNGNYNSGHNNNGDYNSGNYNSGDYNSGNFNNGDCNNGNFNSGYYNSGVFCTKQREDSILIFDTPSNMNWTDWYDNPVSKLCSELVLNKWIDYDSMSIKEKKEHSEAYSTKGYLKVYTYKEAWKNLWNTFSEGQKSLFKTLPNWNPDKFEFITGIKYK